MTYQPREHRDALEVDRQLERGACGHGRNCTCIRNIGPDGVARIAAELKAENDARGFESPPRGRYLRRV